MAFTKTVGHEKQKLAVALAAKTMRLSHAYALVGEENIGKTAFALEIASEVLGADEKMDLMVLGENEEISVDSVRKLRTLLSLTPRGRHKVGIIKGDGLGVEAANALLKTLEEPPAHSVLFITISNFSRLLPTIASRVQRISFGRAPSGLVVTAISDLSLPEELTREIVRLAAGRIGLARRLATDQQFLELTRMCEVYYQDLNSPSLLTRMRSAELVAGMETPEIKHFLEHSLRRFTKEPQPAELGKKLTTALSDFEYNVNTKLALDNLFI